MPNFPSIKPIGTPFKLGTGVWADITEMVIPHSTQAFIPFKLGTGTWADITELVVPHSELGLTPYKLSTPVWGELFESGVPDIASHPDPSSFPYIERTNAVPIPDNGDTDVNPQGGLFIPCADRVATIEDKTSSLIDNFLPSPLPQPAEPVGLNPIYTKVRIRYNSGAWIVIYENGSGKNGWSAVSVINDYAGYERDLYAGYDYALTGQMLPGAAVDVEVTLVDHGLKETVEVYSFTTAAQSAIQVDRIFVVQELLLRVDFTGELAITPELLDPLSYSLVPTRPVGDVQITGVLQPEGTTTNKIFLQVIGLKLDQFYSLSIPAGTLKDREGRGLKAIQFTWRMRRTKMDVTVAGLPGLYDTRERTTIGGILEAIMISDEEIGGDY